MKRDELIQIAKYLEKFKKISSAKRVDDTIIKIGFDRGTDIFFDMRRGDSHIFMKDNFKISKIYQAPFDVILSKKFANSLIEEIEVLENDRVLRIHVLSSSKYKSEKTVLQLEFTGRNTNVIILDVKGMILEALRHIDALTTYREVRVGVLLKDLLARSDAFNKDAQKIEDVEEFLGDEYEKRAQKELWTLKKQKFLQLEKKIKKLEKILNSLENEEELLKKSDKYSLFGTLIFSNIDKVKGYQKNIELEDFDGKIVNIVLPKEARSAVEAGNLLFNASKKLKRKAKSLYIERENLTEKIEFFQKMQNALNSARDEAEINILFPKQKLSKKTKSTYVSYESFYMEGFKIMLGKNEKGNIELLKDAKKRDIWLHLKDIPSAHVIIRTDKQTILQSVLEFAAKLCVDFSVSAKGSYLVDYTQRRNVKMLEGANVNYVNYKTISVAKE